MSAPLSDVDLVVRTEDGIVVARSTSDADGRFRLHIDAAEMVPMYLEASLLGCAGWETAPFRLEGDTDLETLVRIQSRRSPWIR